jgi:hypothetical protein
MNNRKYRMDWHFAFLLSFHSKSYIFIFQSYTILLLIFCNKWRNVEISLATIDILLLIPALFLFEIIPCFLLYTQCTLLLVIRLLDVPISLWNVYRTLTYFKHDSYWIYNVKVVNALQGFITVFSLLFGHN